MGTHQQTHIADCLAVVFTHAAITGHETLQMLKRYTHSKTRRLVDRMAWPDDASHAAKTAKAPDGGDHSNEGPREVLLSR